MAHLPPWPTINKYRYRNIWTARYRALQHHKADMGFHFLALLMSGGYISVLITQYNPMYLGFAVILSVPQFRSSYILMTYKKSIESKISNN